MTVCISLQRFAHVLQRGIRIGQQDMPIDVIRIAAEHILGPVLRLFEPFGRKQQCSQFDLRFQIVWLQIRGSNQLLIRPRPDPLARIGLRQPIVCVGKGFVDLDGVQILNGGLAILSLVEIAVPTGQILLLANIGVASAARHQRQAHGEYRKVEFARALQEVHL